MSGIYEEVEIEDMTFTPDNGGLFTFPCPCGDKFIITLDELLDGDDIANCPSCTLKIKVIYDEDVLATYDTQVQQAKELAQQQNEQANDQAVVA
eukprot:gene25156-30381_t